MLPAGVEAGGGSNLHDGLRDFLQTALGCTAEAAEGLHARSSERRYPPRAVILRQGDRGSETYLLVAGRAQALLYGLDGQLVLLQEFAPGDIFGALAEPDPEPQPADVVAVDEVRAAIILAMDFLALIDVHASLGLAVSRLLLKQLRAATGRMVERSTLSAVGRVHAELLRLARAADGHTIRPVPVFAALAIRVQSTRETVSRTISALERRGLVRREADALVLTAPGRIEDLVV